MLGLSVSISEFLYLVYSHQQAVTENVNFKHQVFAELERPYTPHCILATNTSTIDLELIGQNTNCQERIVGAHFFK
jgi:enoyl-CoA hydratase/3-hydroxyacyl-CoA dehydrogenase